MNFQEYCERINSPECYDNPQRLAELQVLYPSFWQRYCDRQLSFCFEGRESDDNSFENWCEVVRLNLRSDCYAARISWAWVEKFLSFRLRALYDSGNHPEAVTLGQLMRSVRTSIR